MKCIYFLAIRMERLFGRVPSDGQEAYVLPIRDNQRPPVRGEDIRHTCNTIFPSELVLRMDGLSFLRTEERHCLHTGVRPVKRGDLPVCKNDQGTNIREPRHAKRSGVSCRQQARPAVQLECKYSRFQRIWFDGSSPTVSTAFDVWRKFSLRSSQCRKQRQETRHCQLSKKALEKRVRRMFG